MKIIDYFFYMTYRFAHLKLKKDEFESKWSAFLHTGVYLAALITIFICVLGLLFDNPVSELYRQSGFVGWILIWILSPVILSFRYYRKSMLDKIENQYLSLSDSKQEKIKRLIIVIMVILPVLLFVFYRLYTVGRIIWW